MISADDNHHPNNDHIVWISKLSQLLLLNTRFICPDIRISSYLLIQNIENVYWWVVESGYGHWELVQMMTTLCIANKDQIVLKIFQFLEK